METRVITAHVPVELADKVDSIAEQIDRSRAWIVKQALAAWVDLEEERHRMTLEGLADIEAGRVVDHAEIVAWIDSLEAELKPKRRRR
jgi:predicted transcriptional regulator